MHWESFKSGWWIIKKKGDRKYYKISEGHLTNFVRLRKENKWNISMMSN